MATSPDARDLTTVVSVQNYLTTAASSSLSAKESDVIQELITAASLDFLRWTGRRSLNNITPFTERYDGSGSDRQFLRGGPVIKMFSVTVDAAPIPASDGVISPGYLIDPQRDSISIFGGGGYGGSLSGPYARYGTSYRINGGYRFNMGRQNVVMSYLGGYSLVDTETAKIPTTPFQVTVAGGANLVLDMGVLYVTTGVPLFAVPTSPGPGQYTVSAVGVYTFNVADAGATVVFSYAYNGAPIDVREAADEFVAQNYRRRSTIDEKAKVMGPGMSTVYRDWIMTPKAEAVIRNYRRTAVGF